MHENQEEYYRVLQRADKAGDSTEFVEFMLGMIRNALKELRDNQSHDANAEANEATREANEAKNGTIEDQILRLIRSNPKISQTRIAEEIGVSRSTVQRAFSKLIESGQVRRSGGTRGSWITQEKH